MSERQGKSGGGLAIALAALVALGLPVLYALSVGPFVWLVDRGYLPESLVVIYMPLELLVESSDWFRAAAEWYVELWE
jgi:hypothetical protein